jgi:hypothetical protein
MRHIRNLAAVFITATVALAGCSSADNHTSPTTPVARKLSSPAATPTTVQLVWSHTGTFFDDTQVWYVARVKNPGGKVASVALDANALDKTETIVGSSENDLPNIPPRSSFDYFGYLGGGGALDDKLTGTPSKIEVTQPKDPFGQAGAIDMPMLKTGELKFIKGSEDTETDAPDSYNLTVRVTNSTSNEITGGVTQQVVLYDAKGNVVGGDVGSSDNVPDRLAAGASYREQWTGIPALSIATRAVYTLWAE